MTMRWILGLMAFCALEIALMGTLGGLGIAAFGVVFAGWLAVGIRLELAQPR